MKTFIVMSASRNGVKIERLWDTELAAEMHVAVCKASDSDKGIEGVTYWYEAH